MYITCNVADYFVTRNSTISIGSVDVLDDNFELFR